MQFDQYWTRWYPDYGYHIYWWIWQLGTLYKAKGNPSTFARWLILQTLPICGEQILSLWEANLDIFWSMQNPTPSHDSHQLTPTTYGHTMMDWIHSQTESPTGLAMEGKVLQWKWYLSEFLHNQDVAAKGSVPSHTEEIAQLPITPIPKPTQKRHLLDCGNQWSQQLANTWFTDGSSAPDRTKTRWKATAYRLRDGTDTYWGRNHKASATHWSNSSTGYKTRKAKGKSTYSPKHGLCAMV